MAAIDIDKVRIVVVGDSGVGKSSFIHALCHNEPISNPSWTVGCSVDVKLHEYREGTPSQRTFFAELWDIGGSSGHRNTRSVFYTPAHGMSFSSTVTGVLPELNVLALQVSSLFMIWQIGNLKLILENGLQRCWPRKITPAFRGGIQLVETMML